MFKSGFIGSLSPAVTVLPQPGDHGQFFGPGATADYVTVPYAERKTALLGTMAQWHAEVTCEECAQ